MSRRIRQYTWSYKGSLGYQVSELTKEGRRIHLEYVASEEEARDKVNKLTVGSKGE
jgi:hypothetical protein